MTEGCGGRFSKLILILFNFIFWMSGVGIMGVGVWVLVDPRFDHYYDIQETSASSAPLFKYAAYALLGIGGFVFLVGFVGCCGAIKESKCLLGLYMFLMFIIMAAEFAAGIFVLVYKETAKALLLDSWKSALNETYGQESEQSQAFTKAQDVFQVELKCCGADNGYADYDTSTWRRQLQTSAVRMPNSCCLLNKGAQKDKNITYFIVDKESCQNLEANATFSYYHQKDCYDALTEWLDNYSIILIGVGIGVAFVELFGFIFSVLLCRDVLGRNDDLTK